MKTTGVLMPAPGRELTNNFLKLSWGALEALLCDLGAVLEPTGPLLEALLCDLGAILGLQGRPEATRGEGNNHRILAILERCCSSRNRPWEALLLLGAVFGLSLDRI